MLNPVGQNACGSTKCGRGLRKTDLRRCEQKTGDGLVRTPHRCVIRWLLRDTTVVGVVFERDRTAFVASGFAAMGQDKCTWSLILLISPQAVQSFAHQRVAAFSGTVSVPPYRALICKTKVIKRNGALLIALKH